MSGVSCNWGPSNPHWTRCTCHDAWFGVTPPPPCPMHPCGWTPTVQQWTWTGTGTLPTERPLTDSDIDRIARRLAEILREDK